jgi:lantibiotic modifying enzyme
LQSRDIPSSSIIVGDAGCCLFDNLYIKHTGGKLENEIFHDKIQQLAENSIGYPLFNFSYGKSGINWFFTYLYKKDIIDKEDLDSICDDDYNLAEIAIDLLRQGMYDFLHGALGIAYQLLYTGDTGLNVFFEDFFRELEKFSYNNTNELYIADYDFLNEPFEESRVNLGLAHGLPSILKFCLQCYKQGICTSRSKSLALDIIVFIRQNQNEAGRLSVFPNHVYLKSKKNLDSRLGWCYGDLTVAYILYQAGLTFGDTALQNYAIEILLLTTERKTYEKTFLNDAGFCHGSAGLAHIYNRIWRLTQMPVFKEVCDFWIRKTLDYSTYADGLGGYKTFQASTNTYINDFGLLEGASGIGLALLSYVTGDFSWDYCLMLND